MNERNSSMLRGVIFDSNFPHCGFTWGQCCATFHRSLPLVHGISICQKCITTFQLNSSLLYKWAKSWFIKVLTSQSLTYNVDIWLNHPINTTICIRVHANTSDCCVSVYRLVYLDITLLHHCQYDGFSIKRTIPAVLWSLTQIVMGNFLNSQKCISVGSSSHR